MKLDDIVKVLAKEFGQSAVPELNKLLKEKASQKIKFSLLGKKLGHLGYTVAIKNIVADGLKVFDINKVILIKFVDIERFEKAKPRVDRPGRTKVPAAEVKKPVVSAKTADKDKEPKKIQRAHSGSAFIPGRKSR